MALSLLGFKSFESCRAGFFQCRLLADRIALRNMSKISVKISETKKKTGVILGIYECKEEQDDLNVTSVTRTFHDESGGKLGEALKVALPNPKKGKSVLLYNVLEKYPCLSIVGLGPLDAEYDDLEEVEIRRENIRSAVAAGARALRDAGVTNIDADSCGDPEATAEALGLSLYSFDDLKSDKKNAVEFNVLQGKDGDDMQSWKMGLIKAEAQNIARRLTETPANHMTPTIFADRAQKILEPVGVTVIKRDKEWAKEQGMGSFLSVSHGSVQPPVFLEMHYKGLNSSDKKPLVLVGKGITFDSGGISIKPSANMDRMRGDMGGAACVVGTIFGLASLKVPIDVIGLTPLTENMPSGSATKPGDVVKARNGKTIQIDNTDAEGRLVLADALCYSEIFDPELVIDMATLTGAMSVALGGGATGVFSNSRKMFELLQKVGTRTGDRVWRMPLFEVYSKKIKDAPCADLNNIGAGAGACTAAGFLKEFVTCKQWMHLDIAGVMRNEDDVPYLGKGMAGRPTRTLIEFARELAKTN